MILASSTNNNKRIIFASFTVIDYKKHCLSKFFGIKVQGDFFQKQSADEVVLRVGLFLSIGHMSSVSHKSKGSSVFEFS